MKTIKYLSLFSGIGGFELGLQNSKWNFECIGYSEIDKFAKAIYARNFPRHRDLGDAREIRAEELPDFDLLVGGFPCQAFSLSGKRKGFDDTRGTLFFEIARICEEKKPRYILLENVKGLLSHNKGKTYKKILGVLSELGYDVEWQIHNSKDHGVPQNRERLYIKGYFRAECGREILSQKRDCQQTDVRLKPVKFDRQVRKRVHTCDHSELSRFLRKSKKAANATVKEISVKLDKPVSEVEHWFRSDKYFAPPTDDIWFDLKEMLGIETDKVAERLKNCISPTMMGQRSDNMVGIKEDFEIEKVYNTTRKFNGNTTDGTHSPCLTASMGCGGNNIPMLKLKTNTEKGYDEVTKGDGVRLCHPSSKLARGRTQKGQTGALSTGADWGTVDRDYRIRRLTPKECERLQAFPDDWSKYGKDGEIISDTQRYKCLGNAVTTSVVTYIADRMFGGYFES